MNRETEEIVGDVDSFEWHAIWTISNYRALHNSRQPFDHVVSPFFSLGNVEYKWMLRLYPKGCNKPGHLSVFLENRSRLNIEATASFALVTGTNQLRSIKTLRTTTYENVLYKTKGKGLGKFITIEELLDGADELLDDNELKVYVELADIFVSNSKENDQKFQEMSSGSEQIAS